MKNLLRDAMAITGLACFSAGLYLQFGVGVALIAVGAALTLIALASAWRR